MSKVDVKSDPNTYKVSRLIYTNGEFSKEIEVYVYSARNKQDANNIGTILEKYRNETTDREAFYAENTTTLTNHINRAHPDFDGFNPDYSISFFPADQNRRNLLELFSNRIIDVVATNPPIDISNCFFKTDPMRSVVDGMTEENFVLRLPDTMPVIRNLLIIDDVIDEGRTVRILIDKLLEAGKINNETVIKLACIYNNMKMPKQDGRSVLERMRAEKNKNSE